jgi:cytochrome c5
LALAVAAAAAGVAGVAGAQTADRLPYFAGARALFERTCNVCHGLERPLSKTFDRAGWERTVERMHDNGAEASGAEREQIVAYLLTKNIFEARCSACHGIDRPLGASKSAGDWRATVERMSAKKPGHLSDAEVADIAAYLAVTRPLP